MTSEVTAIESSLARAYVGSSGFSYSSWKGGFYPADAKEIDFLGLYADRLPAVEVNSTFYQLPSEATFERWAEATPPARAAATTGTNRTRMVICLLG